MSDDATKLDAVESGLRADSWSTKADALRSLTAKLSAGEVDAERELTYFPLIIDAARDAKWEVQKAAVVAMAELRHSDVPLIESTLSELARGEKTHFVKDAAHRALKRLRARMSRQKEWNLADEARDPTLQHIVTRIREIGLRSMTPARIYDLAMEVSEQSYREVAADTAHEMRNIIAPFEGYLIDLREQLSSGTQDKSEALELTNLILSRLEHVTRLVADLEVYSEPASADFSPTNLASLVQEALDVGADRSEEADGAELIKQVVEVPSAIILDALPGRLVRAITNLVANAYHAMESGGTVTIRASVSNGDRVHLTIADSGKGMTPEAAESAKLRFRSTRRAEGGTGLGLPIAVRIIADDHKGELEIESTPGEGTTINITLPMRQEQRGP